MEKYFYEAVIYPSEGKYEAQIPYFGLYTFGRDLTEAAFNAQDALELEISTRLADGEDVAKVGPFGNECPDGGTLMGIAVYAEADSAALESMAVDEAADMLGVSRSRIYAMVRDGVLRSKKVGNQRLVSVVDVAERFNNPKSAGRPHADAIVMA